MAKRRVVVTGLGMLTPLGNDVESTWQGLLNGKSGIQTITHFDTSSFGTKFAGLLNDFDASAYMSPKDAKKMDLFIQYGIAAGVQALQDSGLEITEENATRVGVAVGSGIGGLTLIEENHIKLLNSGPRKLSPFYVPSTIINMISGHLSIMHGLRGPNISIVTACTTGLHNIGHAARMIAYGDADAMVAGGAEKASTPIGMGGFNAMKALSERNDSPTTASRPFDKERDGLVPSGGAASLVIESYESAVKRGAPILGEIIGYGFSSNGEHISNPNFDGQVRSLNMVLKQANLSPKDIEYINAHASSTPVGDKYEAMAINEIFGNKTPVSSTKSMTGHECWMAGASEVVYSMLMMQHSFVAPNINLENPDEDSKKLNLVSKTLNKKIDVFLSNSFGFGGTNSALIVKKLAKESDD